MKVPSFTKIDLSSSLKKIHVSINTVYKMKFEQEFISLVIIFGKYFTLNSTEQCYLFLHL